MTFRALMAILVMGATPLHPTADARADSPQKPTVAEILEDDADGLLKNLVQQDGGPGLAEVGDVYSGRAAIKIIPMQRYARNIPGWGYRITEKPIAGEYRYVRFAWKADGGRGIMLQLHDDKDWNIRFTAGVDAMNWGTKFVAPTPPTEWTVVTRDLFAEFGERTIRGMALTVFEGKAGYFDHIYFGRTVADLDRVDATGLGNGPPVRVKQAELEQLWRDLAGQDAGKAYRAFWTLVAAREESVPFLRRTLTWAKDPKAAGQIRAWIDELEAESAVARDEAARRLGDHLEVAADSLKGALADDTLGPEARIRIERLLKSRDSAAAAAGSRRALEAVRVLEYARADAAKACLEESAKGGAGAGVAAAARAALRAAYATN